MERISDAVAVPTPRRGLRASRLDLGKASLGKSMGSSLGREASAADVHFWTDLFWLDFTMPISVGRGRPCFL